MTAKRHLRTSVCAVWLAVTGLCALAPIRPAAQTPSPQQSVEGTLQDARRLFEATDFEGAETALDRAILALGSGTLDSRLRDQLAAAYELRARARFSLEKREAAVADFTALIGLTPGYRLPAGVSPRVQTLFDELRRGVVGQLLLELVPENAELLIDGSRVTVSKEAIALPAGEHRVYASRAGHKPAEQLVTIVAGNDASLRLVLERTSASATIVTIPAGVEVTVDGSVRGTTETGIAPPPAEWLEKYKAPASAFSRPLVLGDLTLGRHRVQLRRPCYQPDERSLDVERLEDITFAPIRLEPTDAQIQVSSTSSAAVILDGTQRGTAPVSLTNVCEGDHTVELRSARGRFVRRLTVRHGQKETITGDVKPAFALLSVSGLRQQVRGGVDLRLEVERAVSSARTVTLFAPQPEVIEQLLKDERIDGSWLAFDRFRRPMGAAAESIGDAARQELSTRLARRLDVQGIAAVTVPSDKDPNEVLLTILAAGSAVPDVLSFRLDDVQSTARAIAQLDGRATLFRPSIGVLAVDVLDVSGPVVVNVEPASVAATAGVRAGDIIQTVNGRAVKTLADLTEALAGAEPAKALPVEYVDRAGAPRRVQIVPSLVPRALATTDRTQLFNKQIVEFRDRLTSRNALEEPVVRLNLAIALIGAGAWSEAERELKGVSLPEGPGISQGTVQYLLGLCYEQLRRFADAEAAWRSAATSASLLTEDGPTAKEAAELKLRTIQGLRR